MAFLENKKDLKDLLERLHEFEEFSDLIQFLEKNGIDHKHFLDLPSDEIEYDRSHTNHLRTTAPAKTGVGYSGYLRDVISLLPRDKLFDLHLEKMKKELSFRATMQELLSDEFWDLSWELRMTNAFSIEINRLKREHNIDLNILIDYWVAVLGFPADVKA